MGIEGGQLGFDRSVGTEVITPVQEALIWISALGLNRYEEG
jgi:hypothetical protein